MQALIQLAFAGLSKVAYSLLARLLTEVFLEKFAKELIIHALRNLAKRTETKVDDELIPLVEEALAKKEPQ